MNKKIMLVLFGVILSSSFCFAETVTITTYYPAPYGVYNVLRLFPNDSFVPGTACTNNGEMYYDNSDNQIYFCKGGTWQVLDFWRNNGTNISNTNNGNVGIGTTTPSRRLDVAIEGNAIDGIEISRSGGTGDPNTWVLWNMDEDVGYGDDFEIWQYPQSGGSLRRFEIQDDGDIYIPGNVGIGTAAPATRLEVNGVLRVVGTGEMKSGNTIEFYNDANTNSGTATIRDNAIANTTCNNTCTTLDKNCIIGVNTSTYATVACNVSVAVPQNCLCY